MTYSSQFYLLKHRGITSRNLLRLVSVLLVVSSVAIFTYSLLMRAEPRLQTVKSRIEPELKRTLEARGLKLGQSVYLRVFKQERTLEVWMQKDPNSKYQLWKTYPILGMSGTLGPKQKEGDKQAPEGRYGVSLRDLNPNSKFHLSFNIGYPNAYDRSLDRTGNFIMVHGGDLSIGCYAMGDPAIEEIYLIVEAALKQGQRRVSVDCYPFTLNQEMLLQHRDSPWFEFWSKLQESHGSFEKNRVPPLDQEFP